MPMHSKFAVPLACLLTTFCAHAHGFIVPNEPELSADESAACEALLCLSSGSRPTECDPAIRRYYDIKRRLLSDTMQARLDFLKMCPTASSDSTVSALAKAISRGAGRCDAATLNADLAFQLAIPNPNYYDGGGDAGGYGPQFIFVPAIKDVMPAYCGSYYNFFADDGYTRPDVPVYVGQIGVDGHWEDR